MSDETSFQYAKRMFMLFRAIVKFYSTNRFFGIHVVLENEKEEGGNVSGLILRQVYDRVKLHRRYSLLFLWIRVLEMLVLVMLEMKC